MISSAVNISKHGILRIICAFVLLTVFLCEFSAAGNTGSDTDAVLKKIAVETVKKAVSGSSSLDEAAGKLSISAEELKALLKELSISPPFVIEQAPLPETGDAALSDTRFGPGSILAYEGLSPHLLLVDKASHQLHILNYTDGERSLVRTIECMTGKNHGDKEKEGDQKTPEGTFFFVNKYSRAKLLSMVGQKNAFLYGDMAFVMNFPNSIDRMHGKNGSGIWLHGTDRSFEETSPNDTRGCVATSNEDINILSNYIDLYTTPIVIVDSLEMKSMDDIAREREDVLSILEAWRSAWEEERGDDYGSFYSDKFRSQRMNRKQWVDRKKAIFNAYKVKHVTLDRFSIFRHNSGFVVTFRQDYAASNIRKNTGLKTLHLIREDNGWKILSEHFRSM